MSQKWEYMYFTAMNGVVGSINGEESKEFKMGFFGTYKGKKMHELLCELGDDGWEAVGITSEIVPSAYRSDTILLKRPKG